MKSNPFMTEQELKESCEKTMEQVNRMNKAFNTDKTKEPIKAFEQLAISAQKISEEVAKPKKLLKSPRDFQFTKLAVAVIMVNHALGAPRLGW